MAGSGSIEYIKEVESTHHHELATQTPRSNISHVIDGLIDFAAGTAGGVACVYTGQPLDTVKVKMQTFPTMYRNGVQCLRETFVKEGIRGLYAGTVPALAANIAENSILFAAYGFCQKGVALISQKPDVLQLNPVENALAGSGAAVFSSFGLCPTELIKCRLQALREMQTTGSGSLGKAEGVIDGAKRLGPWTLTRQILREEGIRGMFRGLTPTFAREVPGYFFFFGGYELSRHFLTPAGKSKDEIARSDRCHIKTTMEWQEIERRHPGPFKTVFCGGVAGTTLWVMIFPADVVKSCVQVEGKGAFLPTLLYILRNKGIKALYKGLGPTVIRSFFATGALFLAYEWTKKTLHSFAY